MYPAVGVLVTLAVKVVADPAQAEILLGVKLPFNKGLSGRGWGFTVTDTTPLTHPSVFFTLNE